MGHWRIQRNAGQPHDGGLQEAEGALVTQRPRSSHLPSFYRNTKHECWLLFFLYCYPPSKGGREGGADAGTKQRGREEGNQRLRTCFCLRDAQRACSRCQCALSSPPPHPTPTPCSRQISLRALITADLEDTQVIKSNTSTNTCWGKPAAIVSHQEL